MAFPDGRKYEEVWKGWGGHMCGQGTMSFAKGTKYEGEWKRGMMCGGQGTMTSPHGLNMKESERSERQLMTSEN
jgi:hypothetical protein